jgi:hypothetical protein
MGSCKNVVILGEDSRASGPLGSELGNSTARSGDSKQSRKTSKGKKKKQDFIKRNIQVCI